VEASAPIAAKPRRVSLSGAFVFWHLLSLDAPTVAMLWAWAFARAAHVRASASDLAVLGIGTWLIYVADRLLDSRAGAPRDALRERHRFHAEHRRAFLIASAAASTVILWLIAARLPRTARREDTVIFAAFLVYFVFVHLIGSRFPRSLAVGLVFAAACAIPAWSQVAAISVTWILAVALFAALCWLNCAAIDVWEEPGPRARSWRIPAMAVSVALAAAGLAAASRTALPDPGELRVAVSILASALLLLALDLDHRRMERRDNGPGNLSLRVLADSALLTPMLFLVPWRM
jgi:hypothetical protein